MCILRIWGPGWELGTSLRIGMRTGASLRTIICILRVLGPRWELRTSLWTAGEIYSYWHRGATILTLSGWPSASKLLYFGPLANKVYCTIHMCTKQACTNKFHHKFIFSIQDYGYAPWQILLQTTEHKAHH